MPGFSLSSFGTGAPANVAPIHKYTWVIDKFYGDVIGKDPPPQNKVLIYARDATLPSWEIEKDEKQGASLKYKFPRAISWSDIRVTWYDTVGLHLKMKEWRERIWTPEEGFATQQYFKKDSELSKYDYAWRNPVTWRLINCWPVSIKEGELSYAESEVKVVDVTLSYDWAVEKD